MQGNDSLVISNDDNLSKSIKKRKKSKASKNRKRFNVAIPHSHDVMKSLSQISISRPSKKKRINEDKSPIHDDQR